MNFLYSGSFYDLIWNVKGIATSKGSKLIAL